LIAVIVNQNLKLWWILVYKIWPSIRLHLYGYQYGTNLI